MKRRNKVIYWIATIWLSLGMLSAGIVQLIRMDEEVEKMTHLGFPLYFITILGVSKILGVIAILVPKLPLLKEWAYAGFTFTVLGAIISHLVLGDSMGDVLPPLLLLFLVVVSWYFRPSGRTVR